MRPFALTYPQLMNQALAAKREPAELLRLREVHAFAERMCDGVYRAQGVPLLCHLVRTASIVLAERQPLRVVLAAHLHAAYLLHQFEGSGRRPPGAARREELRRVAGDDVEEILWAYPRVPFLEPDALARHLERFEEHPPLTRDVLVVRLANELEDRLDDALSYTMDASAREFAAEHGRRMLTLARRLGLVEMADELDEVFRRDGSWSPPEGLVADHALGYERPARRLWTAGAFERAAARVLARLRRAG